MLLRQNVEGTYRYLHSIHCKLDLEHSPSNKAPLKMSMISPYSPYLLRLKRMTVSLKATAFKLTAISTASAFSLAVPASLVALGTVGSTTALAAIPSYSGNPDYRGCATDMTDSGVAQADAIAACAGARYPGDLGACVVDVNESTGLTANSALLVCERSRRPKEVSSCTIDIHKAFLTEPSTEVLQNCGRSLMPVRYSRCVVDIVDATDVAVDTALTQCARAGYRPWTLQPRLEGS